METLGLIAGNGDFPFIFAQAARRNGVGRLVAVAFEGETKPEIAGSVDVVEWIKIGQLDKLIKAFTGNGVTPRGADLHVHEQVRPADARAAGVD